MIKKFIRWPIFIGCVAVVTLISYLISGSRLGFWIAFTVVAIAVLINGLIAVVEDEMPGEFNNPMPDKKRKDDQK